MRQSRGWKEGRCVCGQGGGDVGTEGSLTPPHQPHSVGLASCVTHFCRSSRECFLFVVLTPFIFVFQTAE